jgi:hypothetical protein
MWLEYFAHDVIISERRLREKVRSHPFMTLWFVVLTVAAGWTILMLTDFILMEGVDIQFIDGPRIMFLLFLVFMTKSSFDFKYNSLKNQSLLHVIMQPRSVRSLLFAKLSREVWYNLALVALAMGIMIGIAAVWGLRVPLNAEYYVLLILLTLVASMIGTPLAIFGSVENNRTRWVGIWATGLIISAVYYALTGAELLGAIIIVASLLPIGLVGAVLTDKYFLLAWNVQTVSKAQRVKMSDLTFPVVKDAKMNTLLAKEWTLRLREKDVFGSLMTILFLGAGAFFLQRQLGPVSDFEGNYAPFVYPLAVSVIIYLAFILECMIPGLAVLGRELPTLWIMKTLPVDSRKMFGAKVLSQLMVTPLFILGAVLPLPIYMRFPVYLITFIAIAAVACVFLFMAVGFWAGVYYPNMEPTMKGEPEIINMYSFMMVCMFLSIFLIGGSAAILTLDAFLGVLAVVLAADLCAYILHQSVGSCARKFDVMEL